MDDMTKLLTPTIHLNGSSRRDLLEKHMEILDACRGLLTAMRAATPNGRDYYPQGEKAAIEARDAFNDRYMAISRIYDDFEQIALEIRE